MKDVSATSWNSLCPIIAQHCRIKSKDYLNIMRSSLSNGLGIIPDGDGIFQGDNVPIHTAHVVKNWYEEHECDLEHMEWAPQSPDLNIIENLWCVLERQVRNRYDPQSCLKELEQVLMEGRLEAPRSIQEVHSQTN